MVITSSFDKSRTICSTSLEKGLVNKRVVWSGGRFPIYWHFESCIPEAREEAFWFRLHMSVGVEIVSIQISSLTHHLSFNILIVTPGYFRYSYYIEYSTINCTSQQKHYQFFSVNFPDTFRPTNRAYTRVSGAIAITYAVKLGMNIPSPQKKMTSNSNKWLIEPLHGSTLTPVFSLLAREMLYLKVPYTSLSIGLSCLR